MLLTSTRASTFAVAPARVCVFFVLEFFAGMPAPPLCCFNPPLRGSPRHASHCQPTNRPAGSSSRTDASNCNPSPPSSTGRPHPVTIFHKPSGSRSRPRLHIRRWAAFVSFRPGVSYTFPLLHLDRKSVFEDGEPLKHTKIHQTRGIEITLPLAASSAPFQISVKNRSSVCFSSPRGVEQYHKHLLEQALWVTKSPLSAPHR